MKLRLAGTDSCAAKMSMFVGPRVANIDFAEPGTKGLSEIRSTGSLVGYRFEQPYECI